MTTYPGHREADVVLRDGSTVHVRPARRTDAPAVEQLLRGLSDQSRWLRFFSGFPNLEKAVQWATEVDYDRRYGLVATTGIDGRVVGHAGFEREPDHPERAEVALEIADAMQGNGLGTILLGQLAEAANEIGVQVLGAEVLPENHQMVKVFRDCGFPVKTHTIPGVILIEFPTSLSPEALERFERREQVAATAAMDAFFAPRSVAVIGASRRRGTVAGELFHNLLAAGFNGPVYPVNPKAAVVQSVLAYKSVLDVAGPVDLAVLVVPAPAVVQAARDCATKGVRAIVVISAGFAETGPEGAKRQRELLGVCRAAGMRLIGPNCLGILNTDPAGAPGCHLRADRPAPRAGGVPVPERRPRPGHHRLRQRPRAGAVVVRVGRQQGRHLRQRPALLLGAGRPDRAGAAVPGVVRQPAQVRPGRPPGGQDQARAGGQERPLGRRSPSQLLPHRGAAGRLRHHRGRPVPPGGRDPHRHPGRAVRRGLAVRQPAGPGRPSRGDRDQRRRAGDHVRGCL